MYNTSGERFNAIHPTLFIMWVYGHHVSSIIEVFIAMLKTVLIILSIIIGAGIIIWLAIMVAQILKAYGFYWFIQMLESLKRK